MSIFTFIGGEFSSIGDWIKQLYKILHKFPQHIQEVMSNPLSLATLIGCIALLIVLIKAKKNTVYTSINCQNWHSFSIGYYIKNL